MCGQVPISQSWQALASRQTLCAARGSRCSANGDNPRKRHFAVDNRVVVPAIPPKLCTRTCPCREKLPHRGTFPPRVRPYAVHPLPFRPSADLDVTAGPPDPPARPLEALQAPAVPPTCHGLARCKRGSSAACKGHGQPLPACRQAPGGRSCPGISPLREVPGRSNGPALGFACYSLIAL